MGHIDLFSFTRKICFMRDELHYVDSVEKTLVEENPGVSFPIPSCSCCHNAHMEIIWPAKLCFNKIFNRGC